LPKTFGLLENIDIVNLFPRILIMGFVLGSIGSLESLLSSVAADNIAGTRHKSNRELIGQGIGNIMNALFSALPSAGSELHNMANYRAGGRTRLSSLVCGLSILLKENILAIRYILKKFVPLTTVPCCGKEAKGSSFMNSGVRYFSALPIILPGRLRAQ
jgi:MFS superfamily sulfate permease-like transporter